MTHHDPTDIQPCGWRDRFDALVAERMSTPYAWGVHDCCLWTADCALATTGVDHAAAWRGTYSDAAGAMRLLAELGGLAALAGRAGYPIPPLTCATGDIGIVEHDGRQSLAVCAGPVWLVAASQGLAALPLEMASSGWRVAHG